MNKKEKQVEKVGKIDRVEINENLSNTNPQNKWSAVIKAFNPLGHVQEAYAKTLAYKIESKRLSTELERIKEQAKIANNVTDKTYQLKMEELQQRRLGLVDFYNTVNNELERLHIERIKVLEMAQLAQQQAFKSGITIEEKTMFKDMAIEITKELPKFGEQANVSLKNLVDALPPIQITNKLLNE